MHLEAHDAEEGNTLFARVNDIDYDYQAEMWVQDLATDGHHGTCVRFVLIDGLGERAVWERPEGKTNAVKPTYYSDRFTGQWKMGLEYPSS